MKLALRVAFLVVLIWVLASVVGGINVRVGGKGKKCRGDWRQRQPGAGNLYTASGMGAEMIATPGTQVAPVGQPLVLY